MREKKGAFSPPRLLESDILQAQGLYPQSRSKLYAAYPPRNTGDIMKHLSRRMERCCFYAAASTDDQIKKLFLSINVSLKKQKPLQSMDVFIGYELPRL